MTAANLRATPRATPLARRLAQMQGIALETLSADSSRKEQKGQATKNKIKASDVLDAMKTKTQTQTKTEPRQEQGEQGRNEKGKNEKRLFASPRARARAKEAGIDLALLQGTGTGPEGRIVQQDIEQALLQRAGQSFDKEQPSTLLPLDTPFELRPHSTMRKVIAQRLTLSKTTIPHFTLTVACRIDALVSLREQINRHFHEQDRQQDRRATLSETHKPFKVSLNDLLVKALALSLDFCSRANVDANVAWTDEGMKHFLRVDVAVAVAVPGGLVTPIVRDAAAKPFLTLAQELHTLIARARQGKLQPQDYTGGTISISNLGMFGIHAFQAIINPPQAAILAIGAAEKIVTKDATNSLVEQTRLYATLSADHRAIDGAVAAQLCDQFKRIVEQPALLLLDHENVM